MFFLLKCQVVVGKQPYRQYVSEHAWLYSNNTYLQKTGVGLDLAWEPQFADSLSSTVPKDKIEIE